MTEEGFQEIESNIRLNIANSDKPCLGLLLDIVDETVYQSVYSIFQDSIDPLQDYRVYSIRYPGIFASYLVNALAVNFGTHGYFEVYPIIEKSLHMHKFTEKTKDTLLARFRKSCLKLGLDVSTRQGNSSGKVKVKEYLRQVGVPFEYIGILAQKMSAYGQLVGLPDEDDPGSIDLWRNGFLDRLEKPFSQTARAAFELDEAGYYVIQFMRVINPAFEIASSTSELERRMYEGLENTKRVSSSKQISIPQIVFKDGLLGVLLPPGDDEDCERWMLEVDDTSMHFNLQRDEVFVPFEGTLPKSVTIADTVASSKKEYDLWVEDADNRLLIFTAKGVLCESLSLATEEVNLKPGEYFILTRFNPNSDSDISYISESPDIYMHSHTLLPGEVYEIKRGPAIVALRADNAPLLQVSGNPIQSLKGGDIYPSDGCTIRVLIPEELVKANAEGFTLLVNPGLGEELIEIDMPSSADTVIELEEYAQQWKPGVFRMLIELKRKNSKRSLLRHSLFVWNGLKEVEKRIKFNCHALPENLDFETSENITKDQEALSISYKNTNNRFFRMVFKITENRNVEFIFAVPGIFVMLRDYKSGIMTERSLSRNSTVTVSADSRKAVEVYTTSDGAITLGSFHKELRNGRLRLPLISLLEYLSPEEHTLYFETEHGKKEPLFEIVSPQSARDFLISKEEGLLNVYFTLDDYAGSLRVKADELMQDRSSSVDIEADRPFEDLQDAGRVRLETRPVEDNSSHYKVVFYLDDCQPGIWLINFAVNTKGRWSDLHSSSQKYFTLGILVNSHGCRASISEFLPQVDRLPEYRKLALLRKSHEYLLRKYEEASWESLKWLHILWKKLSKSIVPEGSEAIAGLLSTISTKPPVSAAESWVPVFHPGVACPWVFAQPSESYSGLSNNDYFAQAFGTYSLLQNNWHSSFNTSLSVAPVMGFSNPVQIQTGAAPEIFDINMYETVLNDMDLSENWRRIRDEEWKPGTGDYLGPLHYSYAVKSLVDMLASTRSENESRLIQGLMIARTAPIDLFNKLYPETTMKMHRGYIEPFFMKANKFNIEESVEENVSMLVRFLSLFAQACRLESRSPGAYGDFLEQAVSNTNSAKKQDYSSALSYLLFIGEPVFIYYLIFWELILTAGECSSQEL